MTFDEWYNSLIQELQKKYNSEIDEFLITKDAFRHALKEAYEVGIEEKKDDGV